MLGRSLISLTSMIFCFLRASFFFFCSSYLYLPKSRILQTGGAAFGAIFTISAPAIGAPREGLVTTDNPNHVTALVDEAHAQDCDFAVDARPLPGGSSVKRWSSYV